MRTTGPRFHAVLTLRLPGGDEATLTDTVADGGHSAGELVDLMYQRIVTAQPAYQDAGELAFTLTEQPAPPLPTPQNHAT